MSALVNQEECAGCGICIEVCPVQAISLNSARKAQIDSEKCIECGNCAEECPNQAIELVQVATSTQKDLSQVAQKEPLRTPAESSALRTKPQTGGILQSIIRKLPDYASLIGSLWESHRSMNDTMSSSQPRRNDNSGQRKSQGRGGKGGGQRRHRRRKGR